MFQSDKIIEKPVWNELCKTVLKVIRLTIPLPPSLLYVPPVVDDDVRSKEFKI